MLPGIICTIKIGKLCRCSCLSRGRNACILIFSAAGSCWMPSEWFSHPPGTPVTASAHAGICKTFFSGCQHHHSGQVRALSWIASCTKCDLVPLTNTSSLSNTCHVWLIKVQRSSWLEHILLSVSLWPWPHDLPLFNFLMIHHAFGGPARSIYILSPRCMPSRWQPDLCI